MRSQVWRPDLRRDVHRLFNYTDARSLRQRRPNRAADGKNGTDSFQQGFVLL